MSIKVVLPSTRESGLNPLGWRKMLWEHESGLAIHLGCHRCSGDFEHANYYSHPPPTLMGMEDKLFWYPLDSLLCHCPNSQLLVFSFDMSVVPLWTVGLRPREDKHMGMTLETTLVMGQSSYLSMGDAIMLWDFEHANSSFAPPPLLSSWETPPCSVIQSLCVRYAYYTPKQFWIF